MQLIYLQLMLNMLLRGKVAGTSAAWAGGGGSSFVMPLSFAAHDAVSHCAAQFKLSICNICGCSNMKKQFFAAAAALLVAGIAQAQPMSMQYARPLHGVVSMGLTGGGDRVGTTSYTNGQSANLRAGGGLDMNVGAEYRVSPEFSLQANVGYHIHFTPQASNGSASFSRVPVEVIGYFHPNERWRVGGGVRRTSMVQVNGSGFASGLGREFENATGSLVEVEYMTSPQFGVKVRYVAEKFKQKRSRLEYSGNHVGIFGSYYF